MASHQILLPWCKTIAGYQVSSNNSTCNNQPPTSYTQTSKSLPGSILPTGAKTIKTINNNYVWQCKYCIYPYRHPGVHFLLMIFDPAFKWVWCLFRLEYLFLLFSCHSRKACASNSVCELDSMDIGQHIYKCVYGSTHWRKHKLISVGRQWTSWICCKWLTVAIS